MRDETEEQAGGMTTDAADVPALIAAAGDHAVRAYREFLDDSKWSPTTRHSYARNARRFFRWAAARGLSLEAIDAPALAAYAAEIAATRSRHVATIYLSPVRGVLGHMARRAASEARAARLNPAIPLDELKQIVGDLDNWDEDSKFFQAGLVLLAPQAIRSIDPGDVAAYTGVPEPRVREYAARLLASGVWHPDGALAVESTDPETGEPVLDVLEIVLDVLLATGDLECRPAPQAESVAAPAADHTADAPREAPDAR